MSSLRPELLKGFGNRSGSEGNLGGGREPA
jgi:hypothetical protein